MTKGQLMRVKVKEFRSAPMVLLMEDGSELEVHFVPARVVRGESPEGQPVYRCDIVTHCTTTKNPRADVDSVMGEIERQA